VVEEPECGRQPRGRRPPPRPPPSLGVPDVSRLCPVQVRLSKARHENGLPAQSKSIERLFGRGRQSAGPRITGGLVSHEQAKRSRASSDGTRDTPTGSRRAVNGVAWPACPRGPSGAWQPRTGAHPAAAGIGGLAARQVVAWGASCRYTQPPAPNLVDPAFAEPSQPGSVAVARRPEAAAAASPAGRVPWNGGNEGVVVMLSDGARAGR
jgi:hypothetical protein